MCVVIVSRRIYTRLIQFCPIISFKKVTSSSVSLFNIEIKISHLTYHGVGIKVFTAI